MMMILQVLLLNGADVNSVDGGSRSALLSACWQVVTVITIANIITITITIHHYHRHIAITNMCLLAELDHCNHHSHYWGHPYNHHNHQGHLHIADILLTAGADVNQQCCQGASPLAVSAQVRHDDDHEYCYDHDQVQDHDHDDEQEHCYDHGHVQDRDHDDDQLIMNIVMIMVRCRIMTMMIINIILIRQTDLSG